MDNAVLNFGRFFLSSIILHDFTQNNEMQCITFKMRENGIYVNKNNVKTKAFIWVFHCGLVLYTVACSPLLARKIVCNILKCILLYLIFFWIKRNELKSKSPVVFLLKIEMCPQLKVKNSLYTTHTTVWKYNPFIGWVKNEVFSIFL